LSPKKPRTPTAPMTCCRKEKNGGGALCPVSQRENFAAVAKARKKKGCGGDSLALRVRKKKGGGGYQGGKGKEKDDLLSRGCAEKKVTLCPVPGKIPSSGEGRSRSTGPCEEQKRRGLASSTVQAPPGVFTYSSQGRMC